jgi:hypothetical protein
MAVLPKLTYRFLAIHIRTSAHFFVEIGKLIIRGPKYQNDIENE